MKIVWTDGTYSLLFARDHFDDDLTIEEDQNTDASFAQQTGLITELEFENLIQEQQELENRQRRDGRIALLKRLKAEFPDE